MPSVSSLLLKIPDEFKPLAAIGIGAMILVALVLFHGISLHRIMVLFKRHELRLRSGRPHLWRAAFLFGWAVFLMLALHILEISAWAFSLFHLGLVVRASDALYFCANAYTTLGYGAVDLGVHWRNISPIIAISGLFTFAWTTSSLVSIVTAYLQLVEKLEQERAEQLSLRAAARQAELDVFHREREAAGALRAETRKTASAVSFFGRRKIWRAEKEKEKQLRVAEKTEIDRIFRQEQEEEDRLGNGTWPDNSGRKN